MTFHGDPARSPGADPWAAKEQDMHPGHKKQRKKRKKHKKTGEPEKTKKRMVETGKQLREVKGQAKGVEPYRIAQEEAPLRDAERGHQWAEEGAQRRVDQADTGRLTINPRALRRTA
jgi:hypothetical protein